MGSKYISKYQYFKLFNSNPNQIFLTKEKFDELLNKKINEIKKSSDILVDDIEEDDSEENDDIKEFDNLEYLKENKNIVNEDDPKIVEGKLIDSLSKKFIKEQYNSITNVIDYDEIKFKKIEELSTRTLDVLKNNDDFILFQPVFIYNDKAITRPDALIRKNNKYILIETKGTTKIKESHIYDITFQKIVVDWNLKKYFNTQISEFYLCLVKYEKAEKNNITFSLCDKTTFANQRSQDKNKENSEDTTIKYSDEWCENNEKIRKNKIEGKKFFYTFDEIYDKKINTIYDEKKYKEFNNKMFEKFDDNIEELLRIKEEFEDKIDDLDMTINPNWNKNSYFADIKKYLFTKYDYFKVSGNIFRFDKLIEITNNLSNEKRNTESLEEIFKHYKDKLYGQNANSASKQYADFYLKNDDMIPFDKTDFNKQFNNLKDKKVYFDFETLNLATRIIDNTTPYMQIVNQVSIVFDHGSGIKNEICNNILIDPKEISLDSFKNIIDALLPCKDDLNKCKEYSYIVYNKSFEKNRLIEMGILLNDEEYTKKIKVINDNLFDLADFFDFRNSKKDSDKPNKLSCSIFVKELRGWYSIKKVLLLAKEFWKETGCVDYTNDLKIHNGSDAQKEATLRFFNKIDDKEWKEISKNLKAYCENDVRAMVAVEYLVRRIINNTKTNQ